jgi:hypothetical protein
MSLVAGWGIDDFPMLNIWKGMLARCYCPKYQAKHPTYIGCVVDEHWHRSSGFEPWFEEHWVPGWQLDKDLIGNGKVYGPTSCAFVPQELNTLFVNCDHTRGPWPLGVSYHKSKRKYRATLRTMRNNHIGYYDTPEEAHRAYCKAKLKYCFQQADKYAPDSRLDSRVPHAIRRIAIERYGSLANFAA